MKVTFTAIMLIFLTVMTSGQSKYNECSGAYFIPNVIDWCSDSLQFSTRDLTPSFNAFSACNDDTGRDMWISFYGVASDIIITITPEAGHKVNSSLYEGVCNNLIEMVCEEQPASKSLLWMYKGGVTQGNHYLLRIETSEASDFKFTVCINNYFAPPKNGADCATANRVCSKNSFTVDNVTGFGNTQELTGAPCFNNSNESNSIWFRWTCHQSGDLTFVLNPLNGTDDLDFVLYKVNGDPEKCDLEMVRCMAAGVIPSHCNANKNCCGPTGLMAGETDISEGSGCGPEKNNFLKPLDMVAGETYALLVNNYTSMNESFEVSFGGSSTLKELTADFEISDKEGICRGEAISVSDKSISYSGNITSRKWFFTPEAAIPFIDGGTDHTISFDRSGTKSVSLIVENEAGCLSYFVDTLHVDCCGGELYVDLGNDSIVEAGAQISLQADYSLEGDQIFYNWSPGYLFACDTCQEAIINELNEVVTVNLKISDERGCAAEDQITINITEADIFAPNVFSPNFDGLNDKFNINANQVIEAIKSMRIYNRWGVLIFESKTVKLNDPDDGWDGTFKGKLAEPGVYAFFIELYKKGGETIVYKGSTTLVR